MTVYTENAKGSTKTRLASQTQHGFKQVRSKLKKKKSTIFSYTNNECIEVEIKNCKIIYNHTKKVKYLGIDLTFKDLLKIKVLSKRIQTYRDVGFTH